jgi:DnaJ-class molecular chaperone
MTLSSDEQHDITKIRNYIINNFFDENLLKYNCHKDIVKYNKCYKCGGTGLDNFYKNENSGGYNWDGHSFCDSCSGVGYKIEIKPNFELYICHKCKGAGFKRPSICSLCKGHGFINWIQNIIE